MRGACYILVLMCTLQVSESAHAQIPIDGIVGGLVFEQSEDGFIKLRQHSQLHENPRLVAIALDLTLGLFGMHRLYLGTDVRVPVAYTLTFGGGGILWLVDLALLIGSDDIESYKNNPHFFMWIPNAAKR
ncbi:MAG: hypothetical protein RLZZ543_705 [Bacteroidota bacterium]